jgi:CheY-like chemotaxis protein
MERKLGWSDGGRILIMRFSRVTLSLQAPIQVHTAREGTPDCMNILIVDDTTTNRILLDKIVRSSLSSDTILASGGIEALELLAKYTPDLVLLDVMMPDMNGLEFLKELRARKEWRNLPVIITTSSGDKDIVREMVSLGISGYLLRPFSANQVITAVQRALKSAEGAGPTSASPEGLPSS